MSVHATYSRTISFFLITYRDRKSQQYLKKKEEMPRGSHIQYMKLQYQNVYDTISLFLFHDKQLHTET